MPHNLHGVLVVLDGFHEARLSFLDAVLILLDQGVTSRDVPHNLHGVLVVLDGFHEALGGILGRRRLHQIRVEGLQGYLTYKKTPPLGPYIRVLEGF